MGSPLLQVRGVHAGHGQGDVLHDVSFDLHAGQCLALLGRNGMGKSTLLATLLGLTQLSRGQVLLAGQDIARWPVHLRARAGLGWVPQERNIFASLTVEENLTVVAPGERERLEQVYERFAALRQRRGQAAHQLSGGEQQMLAIGRALMLQPRILLLDEPLEGLAPLLAQAVRDAIAAMVQEQRMAVILVEQHALQVLPLALSALVLERGRVVHHGASAELLANPARLEPWLGVGRPQASTLTSGT